MKNDTPDCDCHIWNNSYCGSTRMACPKCAAWQRKQLEMELTSSTKAEQIILDEFVRALGPIEDKLFAPAEKKKGNNNERLS